MQATSAERNIPAVPPRVILVDPNAPDPAALEPAAAVLRGGGLVAFPTETVYGLGANALDAAAVARIFVAKGRPAEDPLIVHVLDLAGAAEVAADVPPLARHLAEHFWPGPLTLVLPRSAALPPAVSAGLDSVAVRSPAHPVARALLAAAGVPVAAPSANRFGQVSPTTARHVLDDLGDRVDVVVDGGPATVGVESTVVDVRGTVPVVLRPGGITLEQLAAVAPGSRLAGAHDRPAGPQSSPGLLSRHYAPRALLVLVQGPPVAVSQAMVDVAARLVGRGRHVGALIAVEDRAAFESGPQVEQACLGSLDDPAGAARHLYAALHDLDAAGVEWIVARDWGAAGLGLALRDRLTRAAEGRVIDLSKGPWETAWAKLDAADRQRFGDRTTPDG
jgi:L-threonylcarbamoyladenylate synthase